MSGAYWVVFGIGTTLATAALVWRPVQTTLREARFARARRDFHGQREHLEAKFVQLASARDKPNAPHWTDCDFDDDVSYVRNRGTGEISAFVAVSLWGDGADDPRPGIGGDLQAGTAVFRFDRDHWDTEGRAILNLSPVEVIQFYQNDFEVVGQELARQSW